MVVVKKPLSPDYGTEVDDGEKVDIPANECPQAVTDHNVRYVLAISLGVALLVLAIVYLLFFAGIEAAERRGPR